MSTTLILKLLLSDADSSPTTEAFLLGIDPEGERTAETESLFVPKEARQGRRLVKLLENFSEEISSMSSNLAMKLQVPPPIPCAAKEISVSARQLEKIVRTATEEIRSGSQKSSRLMTEFKQLTQSLRSHIPANSTVAEVREAIHALASLKSALPALSSAVEAAAKHSQVERNWVNLSIGTALAVGLQLLRRWYKNNPEIQQMAADEKEKLEKKLSARFAFLDKFPPLTGWNPRKIIDV